MRVRMKVQITGTRDGVAWPQPGQTIDLPDREAAKLCAAGLATPVAEDKVEKAVAPEPEKRATRKRG